MSDRREDFSSTFPMYDENKGFTRYETEVKQKAIILFATVYNHLFHDREPGFVPPTLELYFTVARRIASTTSPAPSKKSNAAATTTAQGAASADDEVPPVVQPPNISKDVPLEMFDQMEQEDYDALPKWSVPPESDSATHKDANYYYRLKRLSGYFGTAGYEIWKSEKDIVLKERSHFTNVEILRAWNYLFHSIPAREQSKITVDEEYHERQADHDYTWLWMMIKKVITGSGEQANQMLLHEMFKTKWKTIISWTTREDGHI